MPAQKRSLETESPPPSPPLQPVEEKGDDSLPGNDNQNHEPAGNSCDSDDSPYSSDEEKSEFIVVKLAEIRKEVQCPICLGIIKKTRTVMECLHRFCRECIDKSMRLGNNECPSCRTHCASRRSLRDDPNYDALIAALYPDIDKYEEEDLAFHDEEKARNKQIQASIAQTFHRQAEALGKKRTSARTATAFSRRQGSYQNLRTRRNHRAVENQESDDDEEEEEANGHDGSKDSSSADERSIEVKSKRYKRWEGALQSSGANDDSKAKREVCGASAALVANTEITGWGKGGMRSNTRHGVPNGGNGKLSRNNRVSKLINRLQTSSESKESKVSLMLLSLHEEKISGLKRPHLCCSPKSSVQHLYQYISMKTSVEASEIEILLIKDFHPFISSRFSPMEPDLLNPPYKELQMLDEHQTLEDVCASFTLQNLVFGYRLKEMASRN